MRFSMCAAHTYVNDPLPDGWLARMPVIPKAELHLWALVILKHSHHYRLKWGGDTDKKQRIRRAAGLTAVLSAASDPESPPASAEHVSFVTPNPSFLLTLSSLICSE